MTAYVGLQLKAYLLFAGFANKLQIVQLVALRSFKEALALCKLLPPEDAAFRANKEDDIHKRLALHVSSLWTIYMLSALTFLSIIVCNCPDFIGYPAFVLSCSFFLPYSILNYHKKLHRKSTHLANYNVLFDYSGLLLSRSEIFEVFVHLDCIAGLNNLKRHGAGAPLLAGSEKQHL